MPDIRPLAFACQPAYAPLITGGVPVALLGQRPFAVPSEVHSPGRCLPRSHLPRLSVRHRIRTTRLLHWFTCLVWYSIPEGARPVKPLFSKFQRGTVGSVENAEYESYIYISCTKRGVLPRGHLGDETKMSRTCKKMIDKARIYGYTSTIV